MIAWRRTFIEGLIAVVPIILIVGAAWWLYAFVVALPFFAPIEPAILRVFVVLAVSCSMLLSVGYLMRTALGTVLDRRVDGVVNRFPGLRVIYNAVKLTLETFLTRPDAIRNPVKVEILDGIRMSAFKTGSRTPNGDVVVFIPGAPDITSGFVAEVHPDSIVETDETPIAVFVRLLSCGFGEADADERR
jgi:uncharacterized membrane protein